VDNPRPDFIRHYSELMENYGPGDDAAMFGRKLGLTRLGINFEILEPGGQTAPPHAHEKDEEFVFVLEGTPDLWLDGNLHRLAPGDGVAFPNGTGIAHCVLNNSDAPVRLIVVGERHDDRCYFPVNPKRPGRWTEAPRRPLGPHDGRPRKPVKSRG
jgi:uncharacterized cupin superfamily protein